MSKQIHIETLDYTLHAINVNSKTEISTTNIF